MDRHNWSLVMVSYQSSNDFWVYRRGENEYDYEDDDYYYGNEDYYVEDDGRLIHQYPFWIGANENTAFSCSMLLRPMKLDSQFLVTSRMLSSSKKLYGYFHLMDFKIPDKIFIIALFQLFLQDFSQF